MHSYTAFYISSAVRDRNTHTQGVWCKLPEGSSPSAVRKIRWWGREDWTAPCSVLHIVWEAWELGIPCTKMQSLGYSPTQQAPLAQNNLRMMPYEDKDYWGMLLIYMSVHKSYNTKGVKAIVKSFAIYCSSYVSYVTTQIVLWKLSTPEIQMF